MPAALQGGRSFPADGRLGVAERLHQGGIDGFTSRL
jgi:hypothetical protein